MLRIQELWAVVIHAFSQKEQGPDSTIRDFMIVNEE